MHEYAVGGCPEMGELLADGNGIGQEYNALIRQLSVCSNAIIAGLDASRYFDGRTGAYRQFNIKIGAKETAQIYDAQIKYVLPYVVHAWIKNEPLQLHFCQFVPKYFDSEQHRQQVLGTEHNIATKLKKFLKECFAQRKSEWIISLQINHALGETIIKKLV